MTFQPLPLHGAYVVDLAPFIDQRGWFARYFDKNVFASIGHTVEWVQMNHSFTARKGSLRGMHYQLPPFREIKLVRCIAGRVFDVAVDLRLESPTFLQWYGVELSAENRKMFYIPEGFAHGFQTLSDDCELLYHHSAFYTPASEAGLRYDDPMVGIDWPLPPADVSARDGGHPLLTKAFKGI
jgi:dTDP-4-dehydrorhamnose 3,5-epimerase